MWAPIFRLIATFMLDDSPEAATGGVLLKKVFLKISQNSQEKVWTRALSQ